MSLSLLNKAQCNSSGHYSDRIGLHMPPHEKCIAYEKDGKVYHNIDIPAVAKSLRRNQHRCKLVNGKIRYIKSPASTKKALYSDDIPF